jgi:aminoglycoside phosphotransferase (APT) family kinase protein
MANASASTASAGQTAMSQHLLRALALDGSQGGDAAARISGLQRLSGGANMETWSFDLVTASATEPLILRRMPTAAAQHSAEGTARELSLADEAALIVLARDCQVPVPAVRLVLRAEHALGQGYIMSRERGEALPFRLLAEERYTQALQRLAFQCGQTLGNIHRIPLSSLPASLPDHSGALLFQRAQDFLDAHENPSPVLQLALNWLREHARPAPRRTLVHGDFRNGNLLVDEAGLVAVLDWELAHLGDPLQDLGYLCANVWRFGSALPVGGFGDYADLLAGYASVTGETPAMRDIHYWQVHAALSWGMVCLLMLHLYRSGQDPSLERAAIGRRLSEAEIDLLLLLEEEPI